MLLKKRPSWMPQAQWASLMHRRDERKKLRRQLIRFLKNPKLALAYSRYRKAITAANWAQVKAQALPLVELAAKARDQRTLEEMVKTLERVGCYEESAHLWLTKIAPRTKTLPNEWRGEDISGKTVLINFNQENTHGLGVGYRFAHLVPKLMECAHRTLILLEPRQAPTFKRTFPALDVFTSSADVPMHEVDVVAFPDYMKAKFDTGEVSAPREVQYLRPDPDKIAILRKKYLAEAGNRKLIGISWHSSHHGKDVPSLPDWREFIARTDAAFVSLQYGNIEKDVRSMGVNRILVDPAINQLVDMDDFAAQVAAMDGVITIMNTLVNVGSSIGVPTVVLRDDWFRRNLPHLSDRLPYLPTLRSAGRNRRPWPNVFDEALHKLREMWADGSIASHRN